MPAIATLLAAFFGAKFAFEFQRDKEREDSKKRNIVNGNIAIFNIVCMANTLMNFQKQFIEPIRNSSTAFLDMCPALHIQRDDMKLSIETLYFLLETNDRNLLGELRFEELRYQKAVDAINERSQMYIEVQLLLEKSGIAKGVNYSFEQIEKMLGSRLYTIMQQKTDQIINHVDQTIPSLKQIADKLKTSLKKQYPNETIIGLVNDNVV